MPHDSTQSFLQSLPEIKPGERFWFACHPEVRCFNACCSDLTMPLTPYDVLRLCRGLDMSSEAFFEEYALVGCYEDTGFPLLHLRMAEAPHKPCPFVSEAGCEVYEHRSSACRTYPLGRATRPNSEQDRATRASAGGPGSLQDQTGGPNFAEAQDGAPSDAATLTQYFLVREDHCRGFAEKREWSVDSWLADQGLEPYNRMNDRYMHLMARYKSVAGKALLSGKHATMALLCLYQQDRFQEFINSVDLFSRITFIGEHAGIPVEECKNTLLTNAEERLWFAFDWMELVLFGSAANIAPAEK